MEATVDGEFFRLGISTLMDLHSLAFCDFVEGVAAACGDREGLADALYLHLTKLQFADPNPIAQKWIEDVITTLRAPGSAGT